MDFDDQAVGAGGDRGPAHRKDEIVPASAVAWIDDNRQMGELLHSGDHVEIEGVACVFDERPDSPLAEADLIVSARQDVLGAHEELVERGGEISLQEYRLSNERKFSKELGVLHVPGADLQNIGVLGDELDFRRL